MTSRQRKASARAGRKAVEAVRAADAAWLKAYRAKDLHKAASFFDERGCVLVPNSPILTGKNAIAKFIAKSLTMEARRCRPLWRAWLYLRDIPDELP